MGKARNIQERADALTKKQAVEKAPKLRGARTRALGSKSWGALIPQASGDRCWPREALDLGSTTRDDPCSGESSPKRLAACFHNHNKTRQLHGHILEVARIRPESQLAPWSDLAFKEKRQNDKQ
jgi:hypothetical protein